MKKTLSEIEDSLPNGFHDSNLLECHVDFKRKKAELVFDIEISNPQKYKGNIYRKGKLLLSEILFFTIEPPNILSKVKVGKGLWCDGGVLEGKRLSSVYGGDLPNGFFAHYFFLNETNAFICVAAKEAKFKWLK